MKRNWVDEESVPTIIAVVVLIGLVWLIGGLVVRGERSSGLSLQNVYDAKAEYLRAVHVAMWPDPQFVSTSLDKIVGPDTKFVTWTKAQYVGSFKDNTTISHETWVTISPELKTFCQKYVNANNSDTDQLNLRLDQKLGLPPSSAYDTFVEFTVDVADMNEVFRPCGDSSTATTTCIPAKAPVQDSSPKQGRAAWFLNEYYASYATDQPYPWTSLGYTFDWAPKDDGTNDFTRMGLSEFVVPVGTKIHYLADASTAEYCGLEK